MNKLLKIVLVSLAALIILVVAAVVILPFVINPNDYKPQIIEIVKNQTGRELSIPGEIELSVFPWLGIKLGEVELSNAAGFGKQAFARIDAVDVRVQLLPLLKKDIQVGRVELDGLKLDLQRNAQGKNNWDDLLTSQGKTTTKPGTKKAAVSSPIAGLAIGGIKILNAQLNWHDKQHNQSMNIKSLNLETGALSKDQPVNIQLSTNFTAKNPDLSGQVDFQTRAHFKSQQQLFNLDKFELNSQLQGASLPGNKLQLNLSSDSIILNQHKHTIDIEGLQLSSLGLQLYAEAHVSQLNKQPRYQVNLSSDTFSAREISQQLGISLPASADKNALTKIKLSSKLTGSLDKVSIKPLTIQLDGSSLNGDIHITNFKQPAISYKLSLDNIDIDRYLAPASSNASMNKPVTPASTTAAASALPVKTLRELNINGDLTIARLKASGVRSENILITSKAKNGLIRLFPLKADMYQGNYKGDIQLDVRGNTPQLSMNESLNKISIGPLLKDLWGEERIEGTANLNAQLTARGAEPVAIRKTLNGNANFQFSNGIVKGINLAAYQRALNAKIEGKPTPKETGPNQTEFAEIKGTVKITDGLARNNDLSATLPFARIQGSGFAHLAKEVVDYTIYSKFTSEADIKSGKSFAQINKPALPVRIQGRLTQPDISVDYGAVLKALAKKKLDQKTTQKKQEIKKKLEDKLNDKLKNLLKF